MTRQSKTKGKRVDLTHTICKRCRHVTATVAWARVDGAWGLYCPHCIDAEATSASQQPAQDSREKADCTT